MNHRGGDGLSGPVLLLGSTGMLGQALRAEAGARGQVVYGVARGEGAEIRVDLARDPSISTLLAEFSPALVINAAAYTSLEFCERDPAAAYCLHARLPGVAASECFQKGTPFIQVSTDHYYNDGDGRLHDEDAPVRPPNEYARSKYAGEALAGAYPGTLVVRTNIVGFRGWASSPTFVEWAIGALSKGLPFPAFTDMWTSSIDVQSFSRALFDLANAGVRGTVNLAARSACSKLEFIRSLAKGLRMDASLATPASARDVSTIPRATSLGLDVRKAERLLGRGLPEPNSVVETLVRNFREQCA